MRASFGDDEIITINIPAGVAEGMQLSMNGKGNAARHGGINGDLLILIEEEPHPELIRDENDLLYNLLLSVPQAALGATVEVPTIDGKGEIEDRAGYTARVRCFVCVIKDFLPSIVMVRAICW